MCHQYDWKVREKFAIRMVSMESIVRNVKQLNHWTISSSYNQQCKYKWDKSCCWRKKKSLPTIGKVTKYKYIIILFPKISPDIDKSVRLHLMTINLTTKRPAQIEFYFFRERNFSIRISARKYGRKITIRFDLKTALIQNKIFSINRQIVWEKNDVSQFCYKASIKET